MEIPLDAIGTIFIFLIGLPAILLQTLAPEIRRTVMQWRVQLVGFTMAPIVVSGAVFAVGIWLHWHKVGLMDPDPNGEQTFGVNMLWVNIITILVVIAGASTIVLTERWRRATVIGRLSKSAARTVPTLGRPHEQDLINLIQLGRQSHPGKIVKRPNDEVTRAPAWFRCVRGTLSKNVRTLPPAPAQHC